MSTPGRAVLLFSASFLVLMILPTLLYPHGSFAGLDGRAGIIENWDQLAFADPLTRTVYTMGDLFCHQEWARSFIINGSQMAFCQRDVSVLTGVIIGLLAADERVGRIYAGKSLCPIIGAVMISSTFIEWGIEYGLGADILAARIATGLLAGAGIALLLQHYVTRQYEKIMGFDAGG
ncbi:MAG: DUF2085 domain-containing protein [Methanomassiliicoccaceae archaeon]|nr:DUF2085 domain-containing protein [Methanomassiliicoccaceae archaeon]